LSSGFYFTKGQFSKLLVLHSADSTMTVNDESEMQSGIINWVDNNQDHKFYSVWWLKSVEGFEIVFLKKL
jgi:hypothetical protein